MVHAFTPQHLIDFAEYLKKQDFSDENYDLQCIHRTIINRAYLSTYLHAQDWIIQNGPHHDVRDYSKKDVGYHVAILIALETLNQHHISRRYGDLIELRVRADYDIVSIITSKNAQKALDLAYEIQNALQ